VSEGCAFLSAWLATYTPEMLTAEAMVFPDQVPAYRAMLRQVAEDLQANASSTAVAGPTLGSHRHTRVSYGVDGELVVEPAKAPKRRPPASSQLPLPVVAHASAPRSRTEALKSHLRARAALVKGRAA
jgi:hypothetical protein